MSQHVPEMIRIVFHPASGRGRGMRRARQLAAELRERGLACTLVDTSRTEVEAVGRTLRDSAAVVIVGGDGLIHHAVQHLAGSRVPVGLIPAGSGNDLWRMTGDKNAQASLAKIVAYCQNPARTLGVDLLQLRFDERHGEPRYALGAVSWGFEAVVNAAANALPRRFGAMRYVAGLLLSMPKLRGYRSTVHAGGLDFEGSVLAASIANIRSLGGGIKLFPEADFADGQAELMMVRGPQVLPVLPYLLRILRGRNHPRRISGTLVRARVETAQRSYADGESVGCGSFDLQVIPAGIQLIP